VPQLVEYKQHYYYNEAGVGALWLPKSVFSRAAAELFCMAWRGDRHDNVQHSIVSAEYDERVTAAAAAAEQQEVAA
jgi:hypothetical protein